MPEQGNWPKWDKGEDSSQLGSILLLRQQGSCLSGEPGQILPGSQSMWGLEYANITSTIGI